MKKIISIVAFSLLLTGCLPKKIDETKIIGEPEKTKSEIQTITEEPLSKIEEDATKIEVEDFDKEANTLDQDINQL